MRVVLTGFRGTGKTTVGKILAAKLGLPFVDTDRLIEDRVGRKIPRVFREEGEIGFRRMEREAIASLPGGDSVVSAGGGAVIDPVNVENLRRGSLVFLLQAGEETLSARIGMSDRPSLTGRPVAEEVGELLRERRPAYLRAADFCVSTESATPEEVADLIEGILRDGPAMPGHREAGLALIEKIPMDGGEREVLASVLSRKAGVPLGLCGIAGYPCSHSRSPVLWNRLFARYDLPYHYTALEWPDIGEIVGAARNLGFRALSVTIPFKERVMPFLDAIDPEAREIGAVNTVVQCGGVLRGYNTDWVGIRTPVEDLGGARAVVLGAGGAAAAAVYALRSLNMEVTVLNRTEENAVRLAARFGVHAGPLSSFRDIHPDLVVNATSVGMDPDRSSLLAAGDLEKEMTVFDLVYTPPETPLLAIARSAGCRVIAGTEMFIHQAREQFFHVTGIRVPE
ncbi:MAG TPA: shikimate dehydrogenase, partial [Methanomicrobiales archaeon]|nr:shikimate dehydrogenase [Methanomicrobiales archaeon]